MGSPTSQMESSLHHEQAVPRPAEAQAEAVSAKDGAGIWAERYHLEGASEGSPVSLDLDGSRISWERAGTRASFGLEDLSELRVSSSSARGAARIAGVLAIALGGLWLASGPIAPYVALTVIAAGVVALIGARHWPRCSLEIRAGETSLGASFTGPAAAAARELSLFARFAAPRLRKRPRSLLGFLGGELGAVAARERTLRWEYRSLAGPGSDRGTEERFVRARRRIALWNVGWVLGAPAAIAVGQHFLFRPESTTWAYARGVIVLLAGGWMGLRLLPRLQPLLKRWIGV